MKPPFQPGLPRALALICVGALLAAGSLQGAIFGENRAYTAATKAFQDGLWERAEAEFAEFVAEHPKSERVPEAVLLQAQAQFKQGKPVSAIALLTARQSAAGKRADEYLFWIGEAQFQNTNYTAAVVAFGQLTRDFPASARRLEASVGEAAARAKLGEWARVVELLQKPDGAFQQMARTSTNHEFVAHGGLLLAEAGLAQKDYALAEAALQPLAQRPLAADLDWQRQHLLCRIQLAAGRTEDARQSCVGLVSFAESAGRRDLLATSIALQAQILEQLGLPNEAIVAFKRNLAPGTPVERQRQALLKVTELTVAQARSAEAGAMLEEFLTQFSNAPAADVALLTLGELHLKQHIAAGPTNATPSVTNHLHLALGYFDRLSNTFSNSTLVGKAELGRGWCEWLAAEAARDRGDTNSAAQKIAESLLAFQIAATSLPPSFDQAIARFKLADAQYQQDLFVEAISNYNAVVVAGMTLLEVKTNLCEPALYQIVRAGTQITNAAADAALEQLLKEFPDSYVTEGGLLLAGQGRAQQGDPVAARQAFEDFLRRFPNSTNAAQARLEVGRTYELQRDWTNAIQEYQGWLSAFPTNTARPRAEYALALASYQAGNDTNTLAALTNFVAQFATNELAPQAQWWVADHCYGQGDFLNAEKNYKLVFQNWPDSELADLARLMAGRAAVGRLDYSAAIDHFTNLTSNPNCPPNLKVQATFAYGGALMLLDTGETNRTANLELAIQVFGTIQSANPTNEQSALALGEIGKCYFQLAAQNPRYYESASNAYQQVIDSPYASVATRSQAQVGLGTTLETQARQLAGEEQPALLKLALGSYLDVVYEKKLREGETRNLFWVKKAGLEAARLVEAMQEWPQAVNLYRRLGELLPPLKESLERKIQKAQEHLTPAKN